MRGAWLALLLALPAAAALDAFPAESRLGATEARFLVRLPDGGALRVRADAPVDVALAPPGGEPEAFAPAPASFTVGTATAWHGLPGAVEIVARRADATRPVTLEADDGAGGVELEWPAQAPARWAPAPGALALVGLAGAALALRRM